MPLGGWRSNHSNQFTVHNTSGKCEHALEIPSRVPAASPPSAGDRRKGGGSAGQKEAAGGGGVAGLTNGMKTIKIGGKGKHQKEIRPDQKVNLVELRVCIAVPNRSLPLPLALPLTVLHVVYE